MPAVEPKPYALTTVEELLSYMNEPSFLDPDGKQRDRTQRLINGYSAAIIKYLKRQFKPVESAADKIFPYTGSGYLSLSPYEATEIHTVTLYTDRPTDSWYVLPNQSPTQAAQWRANPRGKTTEGTFWSLTLPELGRFHRYLDNAPILDNFEYEVTVNADWGVDQADIPDDVELACWIACSNAFTNPGAAQSRRVGSVQVTDYADYVPGTEDGLSLPRAARALLSDHRRRGISIR